MHPLIERYRPEIAELCRRFRVVRLDVFGSAARAKDFDEDLSDIDFVVEFEQSNEVPKFDTFSSLQLELSTLLGREVDLVMEGSVRNPYVRASIQRAREPVYGA